VDCNSSSACLLPLSNLDLTLLHDRQADLNGDGKMEVLVATHDCRLKLIMPRPAGHAGEGFAAAGHLAEVSLQPDGWPESLMSGKFT